MLRVFFIFLLFVASFVSSAQTSEEKYLSLSYSAIDSLTKVYSEEGAYAKAIPLLQAAQKKAKTAFGSQDSTYADYTHELGTYYYHIGVYEKALANYTEAKDIREAVLGKEHPNFANSLNNLAALYVRMGDYEKGLALFTEAKNCREKALGKEHPSFAASLHNLALLYEYMGAYEKALPLLIQAKDIYEKVFGKEHPRFASSLNNLADLYKAMGAYEKALPLFMEAKESRARVLGEEHPDFAASLHNLAALYKGMGAYEKALPLLVKAKDIRKKALGKEHPDFAGSLNDLAGLYERMGAYEKALPLYIQAKNSREKAFGQEHPEFAASLNNLAGLYGEMKDYEKALPLYIQAIAIEEKVLGREHPGFAGTLNNLAILYEEMGAYEKALPLYRQAKNSREKALGKEHPEFAASLHNLAILYRSMGNYEKALALSAEAKTIWEKALGREHPNFARSLNNLATLHFKMGQVEAAWTNVQQAMNSASGRNGSHRFDGDWFYELKTVSYGSGSHIGRMLESLKLVYLLLEREATASAVQKQKRVVRLATALLDKARNQFRGEQDQLRMLDLRNEWLLKKLSLLNRADQVAEAFNSADRNKSVLLLEAIQSEAAYQLGDLPDSLVQRDKNLRRERVQLRAQLLENRSSAEKDSLRSELIELNQTIDSFLEAMEQDFPKYYQLKYQTSDTKVEEIQALLDEKTALIEYVIADSVLHIFKLDKKEVQWHQEVLRDTVLKAKIKELHHNLSNYKRLVDNQVESYQRYTALAHWFYQKLLQPVLQEADGITHLIIVSDGELGHLPFESFLVEPAPEKIDYRALHYVLNDYTLSYSYSAELWKENKTTASAQNNGALFALAANYPKGSDSSALQKRLTLTGWSRAHLPPLAIAREEVKGLAEQYQGYFAFDSLATERVVREKAGDYAILHLATHGLLDEKRPILSSLALTENGDSLYDNFWQAHEISKMELNADLVVLSACETGYGRFETGNGIASLARSFMYAGVPSLVVSLWQVSDASTSAIMLNFYAHLAEGLDKAQALRQAKLAYIAQVKNPVAAHPAFWSPFILMGDAEPVDLAQQESGQWMWWIGAGAVLLILLIGLLRWQRA